MKSESSKSFHHGFELSEQEIRRIFDILSQQMRSIAKHDGFETNFEVKFDNGVIASPLSLDEITSQENLGSSAIRRLKINIQGCGPSSTYKASLQFVDPKKEDGEGNRSISYKIEGEDRDWVFVTSSQLEERIGRIKTFTLSGSFLRNFPLVLSQFLLVTVMLISIFARKPATEKLSLIEQQWKNQEITDLGQLLIDVERIRIEGTSPSLSSIFRDWNVVIVVILVISFGFAMFSEEIVRYLFPPYNFLWGDYIKVYESRKSRRNFIFVVVILSVILSVAANFIYDFLVQ